MPLLGTQPSDGRGPSPVSKSLQDERRSLEEREGRTPGKESPFSPNEDFSLCEEKKLAFMTIPSYLFEFTRHEPEVVSVPIF